MNAEFDPNGLDHYTLELDALLELMASEYALEYARTDNEADEYYNNAY